MDEGTKNGSARMHCAIQTSGVGEGWFGRVIADIARVDLVAAANPLNQSNCALLSHRDFLGLVMLLKILKLIYANISFGKVCNYLQLTTHRCNVPA